MQSNAPFCNNDSRLAVPVAGALVCKICLATDSELYSMAEYESLYIEYETLTGLWITVENIIEHQTLLQPKPTHSQYDQCDIDKDIIKTEKIHNHEQADLPPALCKDIAEEVSFKTENDDVMFQLLLKCETLDDELDDQLPDDNLPLLDVREMAELSDNGAPPEGDTSNANIDTGHKVTLD